MSQYKTLIHYSVNGERPRALIAEGRFSLEDEQECALLVEHCAEDYFYNSEGSERTWPLAIALLDVSTGKTVAAFDVELELEPVFLLTKKTAHETTKKA